MSSSASKHSLDSAQFSTNTHNTPTPSFGSIWCRLYLSICPSAILALWPSSSALVVWKGRVFNALSPAPANVEELELRALEGDTVLPYCYEWQQLYSYHLLHMILSSECQPTVREHLWPAFQMPQILLTEPLRTAPNGHEPKPTSHSRKMNLHKRGRWWRGTPQVHNLPHLAGRFPLPR